MIRGEDIMTSLTTFVCCLLLSTFLTVASQDVVPECTNENQHCDSWAADGQCEKNPIFMVSNCRLACGKCHTDTKSSSDSCRSKDIDEVCEFWASRCECEKNPGYMYGNCRRACGGCDTDSESQTNSSTCRNKHIDGVCKFWADAGECEKNPGYMNANCRQACGKCDDDSLSETPAVNQTSPCAIYSTTPGNLPTTPEASVSTTPVIQVTTTSPDTEEMRMYREKISSLFRTNYTYTYKKHGYYLSKAYFVHLTQAHDTCSSVDGYLAVFNDQQEYDAMKQSYTDNNPWHSFIIDGSDAVTEGVWTLTSGEPLPFVNWRPSGSTNAENLDCLAVGLNSYYMFGTFCDNLPAYYPYLFLCEVPEVSYK